MSRLAMGDMAKALESTLAANQVHQMALLPYEHSQRDPANTQLHTLKGAPVFTARAAVAAERGLPSGQPHIFGQYGLLGRILELEDPVAKARGLGGAVGGGETERAQSSCDPRLYLNGNAPFSAFICGLQGSGKSHTLSCMLENMLLKSSRIGALPNPLTGLVFHFDAHSGACAVKPCEAAFLATEVPVRVLVSESSFNRMKVLYSRIPSKNLVIKTLKLRVRDLNIERMLCLMSVDKNDGHPPLYMEYVRKILRQLATVGSHHNAIFDYHAFRQLIDAADLTPMQRSPLNLRLDLLESFLDLNPKAESVWDFRPGVLNVVDLSDPFIDQVGACALFDICTGIFLESKVQNGRIIALDEAHKARVHDNISYKSEASAYRRCQYMADNPAAEKLTESLLSVIRQQRHLASRVLISTQEPTISPKLLDLCNVIVAHRFTSPEWLSFIKHHLAAVSTEEDSRKAAAAGNHKGISLLERIVGLNDGEGYLFAPTGIISSQDFGEQGPRSAPTGGLMAEHPMRLGLAYLKIKVRSRLAADGGASVFADSRTGISMKEPNGKIPQAEVNALIKKMKGEVKK